MWPCGMGCKSFCGRVACLEAVFPPFVAALHSGDAFMRQAPPRILRILAALDELHPFVNVRDTGDGDKYDWWGTWLKEGCAMGLLTATEVQDIRHCVVHYL